MVLILLVLFVVALATGLFGHGRVGYVSWSPAAVLLVIVVVLWLTGYLGHGAPFR